MDLTQLESEVEKRRHALDEAKAQAKGLLPGGGGGGGTQVLESTSRFSPAPKPGEHQGAARGPPSGISLRVPAAASLSAPTALESPAHTRSWK